jgi:hypothetical protein
MEADDAYVVIDGRRLDSSIDSFPAPKKVFSMQRWRCGTSFARAGSPRSGSTPGTDAWPRVHQWSGVAHHGFVLRRDSIARGLGGFARRALPDVARPFGQRI